MEEDEQTLIDWIEQTFEQGRFEEAQNACESVLSRNPDNAKARTYLLHIYNKELLGQMEAEMDVQKAIALLDQAVQKGLTFDLKGRTLDTVRLELEGRQALINNETADQAMEQAGELETARNFGDAAETLRAALTLTPLGPDVKALLEQAFERVNRAYQAEQLFKQLLASAQEKQALFHFGEALADAQQASALQPENPQATALLRNLQIQSNLMDQIEEAQQEAERATRQKEAFAAHKARLQAQSKAAELGLGELEDKIRRQIEDLQPVLEERRKSAREAIEKGRRELDLDHPKEALTWFEKAAILCPELQSESASNAEHARRRQGELLELSRLKSEIQSKATESVFERYQRLQRAIKLAGGQDADLEKELKDVQQKIHGLAVSATLSETELPASTPVELDEFIQELNRTDTPLATIRAVRDAFNRIAAKKLYAYLHENADPLLEQARYAEAVQVYDQAVEMWNKPELISGQKSYLYRVAKENSKGEKVSALVKEVYTNKALLARLELTRQQRSHAHAAASIGQEILRDQQQGEDQVEQKEYDAGCRSLERALAQIDSQEPGVQFAMRALKTRIQTRLADGLRAYLEQARQLTLGTLKESADGLTWNDLDKAEQAARKAVQQAELVADLRRRYQVLPLPQTLPGEDLLEQAQANSKLIQRTREDQKNIADAQGLLFDGEFEMARQIYGRIPNESRYWSEASERLSTLEKLIELKRDYQNHFDAGQILEANADLVAICAKDNRVTWAHREQNKLAAQLENHRRAHRYLASARDKLNMKIPLYEKALQDISQVLQWLPHNTEALELQQQAQDGLNAWQAVSHILSEMKTSFEKGETYDDYSEAMGKADQILTLQPEDRIAKSYKDRCRVILECIAEYQQSSDKEVPDWNAAHRALLKALQRHTSSPYLIKLDQEVTRQLDSELEYTVLVKDAEQAEQAKDWGRALLKATAAVRKQGEANMVNLLARARQQVLQMIEEYLRYDPHSPLTPQKFDQAKPLILAFYQAANDAQGGRDLDLERVHVLEKRAQTILHARTSLNDGNPELARRELTQLVNDNPGDLEMRQIFDQAAFQSLKKNGETLLKVPPYDYKKAIKELEAAAALLRKHPELKEAEQALKPDQQTGGLLAQARLQRQLELFQLAIATPANQPFDLNAARLTLTALDQSEDRVKKYQAVLDKIEQGLIKVAAAHNSRDLEIIRTAIEALDLSLAAVQAQGLVYTSGQTQRDEFLQICLERARAENGLKNWQVARQWFELCAEKGADSVRIEGQRESRSISGYIHAEIDRLLLEIDQALANPELTEAQRSVLCTDLTHFKAMDPAYSPTRVENALEEMLERQAPLLKVENLCIEIRRYLDTTRGVTNFQDAEKPLAHASEVVTNFPPEYLSRTQVAALINELENLKRQRIKTRSLSEEYQKSKENLNREITPLLISLYFETNQLSTGSNISTRQLDTRFEEYLKTSPNPDSWFAKMEQIYSKGNELLTDVLEKSKDLENADPSNQYRCRVTVITGQPDPFVQERSQFETQKQYLDAVFKILKDVNITWREGMEFNKEAADNEAGAIHEGPGLATLEEGSEIAFTEAITSRDLTLTQAVKLWEQSKTKLTLVTKSLQKGQDEKPGNLYSYTRELYARFGALKTHLGSEITRISGNIDKTSMRIEYLQSTRLAASQNYQDYYNSNRRGPAEQARSYYQVIKENLTRLDTETDRRLKELDGFIKGLNEKETRRGQAFIFGGVPTLVAIIIGAIWLNGINAPPLPTPTRGPQITQVTRISNSPLISPQPTGTPTPTKTVTVTPIPSPSPTKTMAVKQCEITKPFNVYTEPDPSSKQACDRVTVSQPVLIYDSKNINNTLNDIQNSWWYKVKVTCQGAPQEGWINGFEAGCFPQ
jgi:hypothetical protein